MKISTTAVFKWVSCLTVLICFQLHSANAQIIASDNATNNAYGSGPTAAWSNGSNGGSGFGSWNLYGNSGFSHFIGSPATDLGSGAATLGTSFGMAGWTGYANAERSFSAPLQTGDKFSFNLAFRNTGGFRGFNLYNTGGFSEDSVTGNQVFGFQITDGGITWTGGGTATLPTWVGIRENGVIVDFLITKTSGGFDFSATSAGGLNASSSLAASSIGGLKFYVGATGGNPENNMFINNLQVIPEPSTPLLMGLGLAGLLALRKTRKA